MVLPIGIGFLLSLRGARGVYSTWYQYMPSTVHLGLSCEFWDLL